MVDFLITYGYWGLLIASFIAGSFFPFSSEAVVVALQAAGLDPYLLVVYATIGNVLGSLFNYVIGRFAGAEWSVKYLHVKPHQLHKSKQFVQGHGAWMGFFTFIPILGSAIAIALGMMKANLTITTLSIFLGKLSRYVVLVFLTEMII